jgi:hypothetical protein
MSTTPGEQAVIVHLQSTSGERIPLLAKSTAAGAPDLSELFALEDQLEGAVNSAGAGEYDGHEVAVDGSEAIFYAYGPDADALWDVMKETIERTKPPAGSYVIKRFGEATDPTAREVRRDLS